MHPITIEVIAALGTYQLCSQYLEVPLFATWMASPMIMGFSFAITLIGTKIRLGQRVYPLL